MKRFGVMLSIVVLSIVLLLTASGCTPSSGSASGPIAMRKWTNNALKLSFYYPEAASLMVTPDEDTLLTIKGPGDLEIVLQDVDPITDSEADFLDEMEASFDGLQSLANGFVEFDRKLYQAGDHPAAYVEYQWNVLSTNFKVMVLDIMVGDHQYQFLAEYLIKDDVQYNAIAKAFFESIRALKGAPDLDSLKAEEIDAATEIKPAYALSLTKKTCMEDGVSELLADSGLKGYIIADWAILKVQYGDKLPQELEDVIGDQGAAWVSCNGSEFLQGDRHYFIQRFDAGKPASFGDHDGIGTIYLGSWHDIDIPVLTYKCTWK